MGDNIDIFNIVENGDIQSYKKLIGNFDINIKRENGVGLLHKAIAYQRSEIAFDLMDRSIDVNMQDDKGQSCLHYLGFFPNVELAKAIIRNGGSLELKDNYGNTPLWYAVFHARGNYDFVKILMQNGANPYSLNKAGKTPIDFASQIKDQQLLEILRTQSKNIIPPIIVFDEAQTLFLFDTISEVEGYIEPYDIDVYVLFDREGKRLKLIVGNSDSNMERVELQIDSDGKARRQELRERLTKHLVTHTSMTYEGIAQNSDDETPERLLETVIKNGVFEKG